MGTSALGQAICNEEVVKDDVKDGTSLSEGASVLGVTNGSRCQASSEIKRGRSINTAGMRDRGLMNVNISSAEMQPPLGGPTANESLINKAEMAVEDDQLQPATSISSISSTDQEDRRKEIIPKPMEKDHPTSSEVTDRKLIDAAGVQNGEPMNGSTTCNSPGLVSCDAGMSPSLEGSTANGSLMDKSQKGGEGGELRPTTGTSSISSSDQEAFLIKTAPSISVRLPTGADDGSGRRHDMGSVVAIRSTQSGDADLRSTEELSPGRAKNLTIMTLKDERNSIGDLSYAGGGSELAPAFPIAMTPSSWSSRSSSNSLSSLVPEEEDTIAKMISQCSETVQSDEKKHAAFLAPLDHEPNISVIGTSSAPTSPTSRTTLDTDGAEAPPSSSRTPFTPSFIGTRRRNLLAARRATTGAISPLSERQRATFSRYVSLDDDDATVLMIAAKDQGQEVIQDILRTYGQEMLYCRTRTGRTVLHYASRPGNIAAFRALLEAGGDNLIDVMDCRSRTALTVACRNGHADIVRLIITAKGGIDTRDPLWHWALKLAVIKRSTDVVRVLSLAGGKALLECSGARRQGISAAHLAAALGRLEMLQIFVNCAGLGVLMVADGQRRLPSHYAARRGHVRVLSYLLNLLGTSPIMTTGDESGMAAIHMAAQGGHLEAVRTIVENVGIAAVTCPDGILFNKKPIDYAAEGPHEEVITYLLAQGSPPPSFTEPPPPPSPVPPK